jgi:hypothetical protein
MGERIRRPARMTREEYEGWGIRWSDDEWNRLCSTREMPTRPADGRAIRVEMYPVREIIMVADALEDGLTHRQITEQHGISKHRLEMIRVVIEEGL